MPMNPEIKQQWVDALRSGEYKQGKGYLKQIVNGETTFCCVGVLVDIAVKSGLDSSTVIRFDEDASILPEAVGTWADLDQDIVLGKVTGVTADQYEERKLSLYYQNDTDNKTFSEIADYIEENF